MKQRFVDELIEDVEGTAAQLADLGVTVHRPMKPETGPVAAPGWTAPITPPLNVRDNTLILGDEIIETPPTLRARYFETQLLKPVFHAVLRRRRAVDGDAKADDDRRVVRPRQRGERRRANIEVPEVAQPSPYDVGVEIMIDGANCLRLGRDLIVNISSANHALACDWLERHLDGRFRVHRMHKLDPTTSTAWSSRCAPACCWCVPSGSSTSCRVTRRWDLIVSPTPDIDDYPHTTTTTRSCQPVHRPERAVDRPADTVWSTSRVPELISLLEEHGFTVVPVRAPASAVVRWRTPLLQPRHGPRPAAPEDYLT